MLKSHLTLSGDDDMDSSELLDKLLQENEEKLESAIFCVTTLIKHIKEPLVSILLEHHISSLLLMQVCLFIKKCHNNSSISKDLLCRQIRRNCTKNYQFLYSWIYLISLQAWFKETFSTSLWKLSCSSIVRLLIQRHC